MWALAFGLIKGIDLRWIIMGALGAVLAYFVWQYDARGNKIAELKHANRIMVSRYQASQKNVKLAKGTIEELSKRSIDKDKDLVAICALFNEVDALGNTDPEGGVLEGLKKLDKRKIK